MLLAGSYLAVTNKASDLYAVTSLFSGGTRQCALSMKHSCPMHRKGHVLLHVIRDAAEAAVYLIDSLHQEVRVAAHVL